ncbi:MAG: hypothetical protein NTX57_09630 [Armatimonadetes bacterium]|nr:hypothetical protein [Armatimonadota bacterium]
MKRWNVLAASLIAATFVSLCLLPLTRDALRFDMSLAAGRSVWGKNLTNLGVKQSDLPLGGFGPKISSPSPESAVPPSRELPVRLASTTQLSGRVKWAALQALAQEVPESPAVHATLLRMGCKNGGSVGVGHQALQDELRPPQYANYTSTPNPDEAGDAAIMLRSCAAGEKLDPDNAYFPAMAAIAHYSLNQDHQAQAALHRAAQKPLWREYIDVEARGAIRRAELSYGPQNSLTQSATLAMILFPHYASLRAMTRVITAQAMHAEQAGDFKKGLALRRDVALLGDKMRDQSSSLIGEVVGMSLVQVSEGRPGGAPAQEMKSEGNADRHWLSAQFTAYLQAHNEPNEAARWQAYLKAGEATRSLVSRASDTSVFGSTTLFQTQWRLLASLALLGATTLLCVLGGLALLRPWLGQKTGRAASVVSVGIFVAVMVWLLWQGIGNLRDSMAYSSVIQSLAGNSADEAAEAQLLSRAFALEATIALSALVAPFVLLGVSAILAHRHKISLTLLLRRYTLPLAAVLALIYAAHLTAFSLRERSVQAELQRVIQHEGRYIAEKLGKPWPSSPTL